MNSPIGIEKLALTLTAALGAAVVATAVLAEQASTEKVPIDAGAASL